MIITCPNCSTRYSIDPKALGAIGKTVRCSNCGNTWTQAPVAETAPLPAMPQQQYGQPTPPPPHGQSQTPAQPGFASPTPPPPPEPMPEPEPKPTPKPEPEPKSEPEIDGSAGIDVKNKEETDNIPASEAETPMLSEEELNEMFKDEDEPEAVESIVESPPVNSDDDFGDIDDIPDPEPIPQVFTADVDLDDDELGGGKSKIIVTLLIILFIISGLGAGIFFGKDEIITMWPPAKEYYDMISHGDEMLGEGLEIRQKQPVTRDTKNGADILIYKAIIANLTDQTKTVPMIKIILQDAEKQEVQSKIFAPETTELAPAEKMNFEAHIVNPVITARQIFVTFTKEMPEGHAPDGAKNKPEAEMHKKTPTGKMNEGDEEPSGN